MINKQTTSLPGLYILTNQIFYDSRGSFKKVFTETDFKSLSLESNFSELYYSINKKDVIRGMHFQVPPMDHVKMIYVITGKIVDVCLDLRQTSKTFGEYFSYTLSGNDADYLYIPKGIAHGFASLENNTIVHYAQTTCYSKEHDFGIKYDSFGFNWNIQDPIISDRDKVFSNFKDFDKVF
ncbi:dTDP-4-dehydrorhamnose 3,5-epimerase [Treponema primitia ZAS-2]|uniref:dTDP-4-dehydrorhamnose 3,5-epimerase n=1 Tax=Treponema primitia (strain ATCC BAA-887 / DSM 12427 / ZAS-2) TaxID=545694 RepID=F5YHK3_TREPZ|nr:dTDP-4-dehydrorhamnose 3,5-epimerase family protein [Treponema primitia]AEF85343.1 dTDP-4-dehydrorhamnose 3,5-epimerase [Treponema primitia ZAS-2]